MTKSILFTCAAISLSIAAVAQARVGVKGGINVANITNTNSGGVDGSRALTSYHAGLIVDLPLSPILSLQPGVIYSGKGSKLQSGESGSDNFSKWSTNPQYIEIPVNLVGKIPVGSDSRIFFGVGPYAAFGVAGKNKYETVLGPVSTSGESKIKWDDDTPFNNDDPNQGLDKYKRFDYGGNLMAGIEFGGFLLSAQYGLGFGKIRSATDNSTNDNNKNRVWSFSVGYLFGNHGGNTSDR